MHCREVRSAAGSVVELNNQAKVSVRDDKTVMDLLYVPTSRV